MLIDERDLVHRCRTGEPGARQEMYETYAGRVLAVCRRYIRESDRARDLVHDTFLKAWDSLDGFRPRRDGSLGAWLSRIAAHLAVDELRRSKHLVLTGDDQPGLAESHSGLDPESPVNETRLRQVPVEELIELIAALPEGYRAVFNLFCLDGLSHREIARLLGITEKTSQTQYLKARHKLAAMIAAKYGTENEKD
ncbi:MAG: sigma-70 family RNA polymerase sigma factor [Bacteroidales bacterium]|nr:sigma-70 family RNA polymerase sigma factor [Bacteroidales bacterium]MBR6875048.1 sigma-70 family RNA polymerase sigma factor [Bacteroidales bacterium]